MTIKRTKKGTIKWSLKHRPPLTVSMITAAILLLQSSKNMLVHNLPLANKELIDFISSWYTYILDASGVLFSFACIFIGLDKTDTKPKYGNFDPYNTNAN